MAQPSTMDVITLAAAKSWAQLPATAGPSDGNIQLCITAASIEFLRLTGKGSTDPGLDTQNPFNEVVAFDETYDGNGNSRLFLRNAPISSVSSVSVNGVSIPQATSTWLPGYKIDSSKKSLIMQGAYAAFGTFSDAFSIRGGLRGGGGRGWASGTQNVAISYSAGYSSQVVTELDAIPADAPYTIATGNVALDDQGITYFSNGNSLEKVSTAPAQGQYYLQSPGVYLFNAADASSQVVIKYTAGGCPSDVQQAVSQMVALNYTRRNWIGIRSLAMKDVGSTSYTQWAIDPSVQRVIDLYRRTAIVG